MTVRFCARRVVAALLVFLACKAVLVWHESKYAWVFVDRTGIRYATVQLLEFTESDRELRNPDRGFYRVYRFSVTDNAVDCDAAIRDYFGWDRNPEPETEPSLTLVEVNLGNYRDGDISGAGLSNIDALLDAWSRRDVRIVLRFLYDWDGENLEREPEDLNVVLGHMAQVGPAIRSHGDTIFTLQGLFVGNWGEMHGTKFASSSDLRALALALADAVGDGVYLSVRTPAQWRAVTLDGTDERLASRTGLFNDGMLGNATDAGTYGPGDRDDELAFQDELCAGVPNGGQVILSNWYNDFGNSVRDLAAMHITYLDMDWDPEVLAKWRETTVSGGLFDGMDGLSYIGRHLGYRLSVVGTDTSPERGGVGISVDFRNTGFAPPYASPEVTLRLKGDGGTVFSCVVDCDLATLSGGSSSEEIRTARAMIPLKNLTDGSYSIYLDLRHPITGEPILLANGQAREEDGYLIGTVMLSGAALFSA